MFPNIARLSDTYQSAIFCDIGVIYKNNETQILTYKNFPKINIGSIPIMVHSLRDVFSRV